MSMLELKAPVQVMTPIGEAQARFLIYNHENNTLVFMVFLKENGICRLIDSNLVTEIKESKPRSTNMSHSMLVEAEMRAEAHQYAFGKARPCL